MSKAFPDFDSLILSRLCHTAPVLTRATEIFSKAKASCTSPGSEHFLGDFRTGLPMFCAFIASEKLNTSEVPMEKAQMAACLNKDEFERGVRTVEQAAGLSPTSSRPHTPFTNGYPPAIIQEKQSLSYYRPIVQTPDLPSPSLLPPGENGYLYQILEPISSPSTQATKSQSASTRKTKRKRTEDSPGEAAGASGSSQHPNTTTDARDRELEKEIRKLREANDSLRSDNKTLTDENDRLNIRLTSLQHLLDRERFDREERDIAEHQELTLLRTALVQLESRLPSMLSEAPAAPTASTSTQTPLSVIADAITAVENMARRRLIITDFPDVETYEEPEDEDAEVEDGADHAEKDVNEVDQVMLDVSDARTREVGTTNSVPTIQKPKSKKKTLPTATHETFSTTTTAAFEDGTKPDHGTMVWARIASHPWYPAVVHDENMQGIPPNVLASKPKQASSPSKDESWGGEKVWCVVNFFDDKRSWGWVPLQKLRMLGNEQVLDDDMLAMKSRMQRKWPSRERAKVLAAYQAAMDNIAPEEDE